MTTNKINYYALPGLFHPTINVKQNVFTVSRNPVPVMIIVSKIASYYAIPVEKIMGRIVSKSIVKARHMCFYFLRIKTELSYPEIGQLFDRNHSTVMTGEKCIKDQLSLKADNSYKKDVEILETYL